MLKRRLTELKKNYNCEIAGPKSLGHDTCISHYSTEFGTLGNNLGKMLTKLTFITNHECVNIYSWFFRQWSRLLNLPLLTLNPKPFYKGTKVKIAIYLSSPREQVVTYMLVAPETPFWTPDSDVSIAGSKQISILNHIKKVETKS